MRRGWIISMITVSVLCCAGVYSLADAGGGIIPGQYIVVLHENGGGAGAVAREVAASHGVIPGYVYSHAIKGFSAHIPAGRLKAVESDLQVVYIEPDRVAYAVGRPSEKGGRKDKGGGEEPPPEVIPTGIDRVDAEFIPTQPVDVDIAIIDTGVSKGHPDINFFRGVTVASMGKAGGNDDNGHGSHVAGITAAIANNNIGVVGVAPGARIWAVKVLNRKGMGTLGSVLAGIDWVTAHAADIEVANMSLGFDGGDIPVLDAAITASINAGIVYVVAAGNDMAEAGGFSPANHPGVITVSAITDTDGAPGGNGDPSTWAEYDRNNDDVDDGADDTFAWFSNFGPSVDIAAPGVDIHSTWKGTGYNTISGTSMSSPHVAGAAALYISTRVSPTDAAGVQAVKQAIINAGTSPQDFSGDPDSLPEPLLNVGNL